VVRERGVRVQGQGRHQSHHTQHPARPARRQWNVHCLRQTREEESLLRARVLVISNQSSVISDQLLVTDDFFWSTHQLSVNSKGGKDERIEAR